MTVTAGSISSPGTNMNLAKARAITEASWLKSVTFEEALHAQAKKYAAEACLVDFPGAEDAAGVDKAPVRQISHAETHRRAEKLAAVLIAAAGDSARSRNIVALSLQRSPAMVVAQLAVFKAGMTFAPLDPDWPVERHHNILDELKPLAFVADVKASEPPHKTTVIRLESSGVLAGNTDVSEQLVKQAEAKMVAAGGQLPPCDTMYVMYTSGSTGRPKGVLVSTAGFWNRLMVTLIKKKCTSRDVFLMKTVYTFDVSVPEIWETLVLGATTVVLGANLHLDAEAILATMNRGLVTVSIFVPSLLDLFLDSAEGILASGRQKVPNTLRIVHCIGEALLRTSHANLRRILGKDIALWNVYGPTEATVDVSMLECDSAEAQMEADSTTGFPLGFAHDGVEIFITALDDPTKLMRKGERGEICIGGVQVASGYLERPELTAERFVTNTVSSSGGNLYRTGDIGRVHPDGGFIEYFGRADRQVKIGGVRLELGEVEAVAAECLEKMVGGVAIEAIDGLLVGVTSLTKNQKATAAELNRVLADVLPKSHLPSEWFFRRDALPIADAGKLDHKAIVAWVQEKRRIHMWGSIYSTLYTDHSTSTTGEDPTMDWAAYFDSFTNKLHTRDVIEEWVTVTVEEVLAHKPRSILEMGCGKGMLLFKLAPHVERFTGADISGYALEHVQRVWNELPQEQRGACKQMELAEGDAADYTGLVTDGLYDLVLCNGVTMYFPSANYLHQHLKGAVESTKPGGTVFLGDVRSLGHQLLFHMRKLVHDGVSKQELRQSGEIARAKDKDRCYDHHMFYDMHHRGMLPGVAAVEIQIKRGKHSSEFTRYRYDVIFHLCEDREATPPAPLSIRAVECKDPMDLHDVVTCLQNARASMDDVLACYGVINSRLLADVRLLRGENGDEAPAVEVEQCIAGGVEPAALRDALAQAFPGYHIQLTWSKEQPLFTVNGLPDGGLPITNVEKMDVYIIPADKLHSGLNAIAEGACKAWSIKFGLEQFANDVPKEDELAAPSVKDASHDLDAIAHEAQQLAEDGNPKLAVLELVAGALGVRDMKKEQLRDTTLIELGGNSFLAMRLSQKLSHILKGKAVPVFSMLTKTIGDFTDEIVDCAIEDQSSSWILEQSDEMFTESKRPQFLFFPTAGGSPRVYAQTFAEIRMRLPNARCLFVQPPGRDARSNEPHEININKYLSAVLSGLKGKLAEDAPFVVCGDSLGSCMAWQFVHELHMQTGILPAHVCVSGNPCPRIASEQLGLGYLAKKSVREETVEDLRAFLAKGGAESGVDLADALRADCILYEDFKRGTFGKLDVPATLFRGSEDPIGGPACDMQGWREEFASLNEIVLEGAGHHIYSERPAFMADELISILACGAAEDKNN